MNFKINKEKSTILLNIPEPLIPENIYQYVQNKSYSKKPEFHITLISFQNGKKLLDEYGPYSEKFDQIVEYINQLTWEYRLVPEYYEIEKLYNKSNQKKSGYTHTPEHIRRSIIQKVLLSDMAVFYDKLSELTGIIFEKPFCHVTLYSWSDCPEMMNQGIGINSEEDLEVYKKQSL